MTVYSRYKAKISKIAAQARKANLTESFSRQGGSHQVIHSSLPNPDDDNVFSEHVYLAYRHEEDSIPAYNATVPVLCSTSMAIAVAEMREQGDCTIIRLHRNEMPEEASRIVTQHDRMMAIPAIRKMHKNHIAQALKRQKRRKSSSGRKAA